MRDNFIYLNFEPVTHLVFSFGISAADVANGIPTIPHYLALLNGGDPDNTELNGHTRLRVVTGEAMVRGYLIQSHDRPLKWLDFRSRDDLDFLLPNELAELLYLGHMDTPMRSPFYAKLQNHYAFLAVRDGFLKVYYRQSADFSHVLDLSVKRHLRAVNSSRWVFTRPLAISDLPQDVLRQLMRVVDLGVILAFDQASERNRVYQIPVLLVGHPERQANWYTQEDVYLEARKIATLRYDVTGRAWTLSINDSAVFADDLNLI